MEIEIEKLQDEVQRLKQERAFTLQAIERLIRGVKTGVHLTSKSYGTGDQKVVKARPLATLAGIYWKALHAEQIHSDAAGN